MVNKIDMGLFESNNRNSIEQNLQLKRSSLRKIKNWNSLVDHTESGKLEKEHTCNFSQKDKVNLKNTDRAATGFGIVKQMVSSFSSQLINNQANKASLKKTNEKEFFPRKALSFNLKQPILNKQVTIFNRNSDNTLSETKNLNLKVKAPTANEFKSTRKELNANKNSDGKFNFKNI